MPFLLRAQKLLHAQRHRVGLFRGDLEKPIKACDIVGETQRVVVENGNVAASHVGDADIVSLLDQADPLPTRYDLEVSSPGAERPLRNLEEYRRFVGKRANVHYRMGESEQVAEGRLTAVSDQMIELQLGEGKHQRTTAIPLADVLSARLAVDLSRH